MQKPLIAFIAIFLMTAFLLGCSKASVTEDAGGGPHVVTYNDTIPPVLELYNPADNQVFSGGNPISISGKISDELGLYRGSIRVTKDLNGELLKEQLFEIHGVLLYNFNISVPVSVTASTDYTVTVFFEDHGLNSAGRTVKIKVNP